MRIFSKKLSFFLVFFFLLYIDFKAQNNISGTIYNGLDSSAISDVNIVALPSQINTFSTNDGFFSLIIKNQDTAVCFINMQYERECYSLREKLPDTIFLSAKNNIIDDINVTGENKKHVESTGGELVLSNKYIKQLPQILGERDIFKILTLMPGVSSGGELSAGLSVRGGNIDQNLILLDGALLFNPTHLFGFLSSFNSDIVSEVKLIKSNIPAEYGNALSSVLSVETESKIVEKPEISGSVGIIAPSLSVKWSLFNRKVQLIISGRRTFIDQLINNRNLNKKNILNGTNYYFYDLNGKITIRPSLNSYIELSAYSGYDNFIFIGKNTFISKNEWGNSAFSAKYIYSFNDNASIKVIGTYSNYFNLFSVNQDIYSLKMKSEISSINLKLIYENRLTPKHLLRTGFEAARNTFLPNSNSINADSVNYQTGNGDLFNTAEYAVFVGDEYHLTKDLSITAGLRFTLFHNIGPFNRLKHNENGEITDTINFSANDIIKQYLGVEPRLGLRYMLNSNESLKFSATRNIQYRHLIAMSSIALPVDVWIPATELAKPQIGYHFSAGWYKSLKDGAYELSVDTYCKLMDNVYEYGEDILQLYKNINYDEGFIGGKGYSYGVEFFVAKKKDRFTGQLSYTLSRSMRKIAALNDGMEYPSKFDRTHNLVVLGKYKLTKRIDISANFVFLSGTRMTIPVGRYLLQRNIINVYSSKNGYRLPPYHRVDVGVDILLNKTKRYESKLNISVYNVYSRKNPFYLYFNITGDITNYELNVKAEQVSLFPVLPSISWSFKF